MERPGSVLRHVATAALGLGLLAGCDGGAPDPGGQDAIVPAPAAEVETRTASEPPEARPAAGELRRRTVYVPAYSHIPRGGRPGRPSMLSILLSVRNVDSSASITLNHVDYFDTSGHRVRRYLDAPRELQPLETAEFAVEVMDPAGGSGANFLVYWEGPSDAHSLLTETVMVGHMGDGYIAFTSRGVELDRRPDPSEFTTDEPAQQGD